MPSILLINVFEVPADKEAEFLAGWTTARDFMQRQPGFISTRLHRSLDPAARFRFVNVAEWATPADFQAAANSPDFVAARRATPFPSYPSLYQLVEM
jgi:heme oxygenase (mycobilin-producing)